MSPLAALWLYGALYTALRVLGPPLQDALAGAGLSPPTAMLISEVLLLLLPSLAALRFSGVPPRAGLGLGRASSASLVAAVLAGAGGFYLVAGGVEPWMDRWLPLPPSLRQDMHALFFPPGGPRPLAIDLLGLSLGPAVCEEVLFRGVLLRALVPVGESTKRSAAGARPGPVASVLLVALAFGFFHGSLYKLLPAALLGVLLGALALQSSSLWPSMLAHALNNALVVLLVRAGYQDPPGAGSRWSPLFLVAAAALVALALRLAGRGNGRKGASNKPRLSVSADTDHAE